MEKNISSNVGKIIFAAIQMPLWTKYSSIYPLDVEGHYSVIVKAVLEKFNWNYEGRMTETKGEVNGDGALGLLANNESDVSFCSVDPDYRAFPYIDYSHVIYHPKVVIVSSDASATFVSSDFAFISIFSSWVWFAWLVTYILFVIFWVFDESVLSRYSTNHQVSYRNGLTRKLLDTYRMSINQGTNLPPSRLIHLRLAMFTWILCCFILTTGFAGVLLSKLTLPPKPTYIDTLEDILNYPRMRVEVMKGSTVERILKRSSNEVVRRVWQQVSRFETASGWAEWDADALIGIISKGEMITFIEEQELKETWPTRFNCDFLRKIHTSPQIGLNIENVVPLGKHLDPGKARLIKRTVQSLFEADIVSYSFRFEYWKNSKCFTKDASSLKKLQSSSIRVVCYGLLLGYLISAIALIFELNHHRRIKIQEKQDINLFENL